MPERNPSKSQHGRVLLADDAPDNRALLQRLMQHAGLEVETVENGAQALTKALSDQPGFDVVLMDMQMPEMDGYQATTQLRQQGYRGPVVALTGHSSPEDRARCLHAGCTDFLPKPFEIQDLINLVGKHVRDSWKSWKPKISER